MEAAASEVLDGSRFEGTLKLLTGSHHLSEEHHLLLRLPGGAGWFVRSQRRVSRLKDRGGGVCCAAVRTPGDVRVRGALVRVEH